jgi:Flp pilus assembly protein TadG
MAYGTHRASPRRSVPRPTADERGAVLPIVALALVALMGMLVLVVDVGGLLFARRELVNGADAAALSAAQACAMLNDDELPEVSADTYAIANVPGADVATTNIIDSVNCDEGTSGYVTVRYAKDQPLFFGPVLGSGDSAVVTTEATANWGGVGTSDGVIPLVVYSGFFQGLTCNVPDVPAGTTCYLWEDNDLSGEGNFGFIDVDDGWNVSPDDECRNEGGDQVLEDWISGTIPVSTLTLNYPRATWSCARAGNHSEPQVWSALRLLKGQERVFPVVGVSPGDQQPAQTGTPKPKYNVIGFARLKIVEVLTVKNTAPIECTVAIPQPAVSPTDLMALGAAQCLIPDNADFTGVKNVKASGSGPPLAWTVDPDGVLTWTAGSRTPTEATFEYSKPETTCGGNPAPNSSAHCLVLEWVGYTFEQDVPAEGENFGIAAVTLCDLTYDSCGKDGI